MVRGKVVVDLLEQCLAIGDLHHAVKAGAMRTGDVHATLAEVAAGQKPGRIGADDITIFDSTGTAIQDVAAAIRIFERAKARAAGLVRHFGDRPSKEMNHAVTD
jgi:ornithine cyclodeaminase/alanine dehydrogenase-like protein (mu-crystallin family)